MRWDAKFPGLRGNEDGGPHPHSEEQGDALRLPEKAASSASGRTEENQGNKGREDPWLWELGYSSKEILLLGTLDENFGHVCLSFKAVCFSIPGLWVLNASKGPVVMTTNEEK